MATAKMEPGYDLQFDLRLSAKAGCSPGLGEPAQEPENTVGTYDQCNSCRSSKLDTADYAQA
jgi:hypothetical protein